MKSKNIKTYPKTRGKVFVAHSTKLRAANTLPPNGKVFVGMSGGVDSSVSAALLKEATPNNFEKLFGRPTPEGFRGYDVTGVFINVWQPDFLQCQRGDDRREAMRAAAHLGIPFLTLDFEKEYKQEVVDYMVREYKAGRTPNPDVMCNQKIKFGAFFEKAIEMGADYVATGHYAQRSGLKEERSDGERPDLGAYALLQAKDKGKDQTYFLWTLTQEHLRRTLFPVGDLLKTEVRERARKFGLPNAEREESQGLCFVGEFKLKDFLGHFIPPQKGDVLNEEGMVIGYHDGAHFLTLGQRHGFMITKKTPHESPYYVVHKDVARNIVTVSHEGPEMRTTKEIFLHDINFISGKALDENKTYEVRFRYRQPLVQARFKIQDSCLRQGSRLRGRFCGQVGGQARFKILFNEPQKAVAPGQSLVIYNGEECLGGGIIY